MKKDLLKKKLFFIKRKMLLDIGVNAGKVNVLVKILLIEWIIQ